MSGRAGETCMRSHCELARRHPRGEEHVGNPTATRLEMDPTTASHCRVGIGGRACWGSVAGSGIPAILGRHPSSALVERDEPDRVRRFSSWHIAEPISSIWAPHGRAGAIFFRTSPALCETQPAIAPAE